MILAKKGVLSVPDDYWGIMLLETAYTIVAVLFHGWLQTIVEELDHENQYGFRPQCGCRDAVHTVKMVMKKGQEHGQETWILFIDLVKAFDRVPHKLLWVILKKFSVPPKLINLLRSLHGRVEVKFSVNDITLSIFSIIGVKQGDILGPILFLFYIAAIMITWREVYERPLWIFRARMDFKLTGRKSSARGENIPVDDPEYADDTAILITTRKSLVECIPEIITHFKHFGADIHVGDADNKSKLEILLVAKPNCMYVVHDTYDN